MGQTLACFPCGPWQLRPRHYESLEPLDHLWNWDSTSVVFGFMPTGLAWQAGISLAAAAGWALMMRVAWPTRVEDWASQPSGLDDASGGEAS